MAFSWKNNRCCAQAVSMQKNGTDGARTHDNQVVTLVLSQLSYRSKNGHLLPTHQHVSLRIRKNCCQHGRRT
jgi:hypothetical protein